MSLFSKDPLKQGEIEDLQDYTSATEEAKRMSDEAREAQEAAMQKALKTKSNADLTGKDDTFISEDDLGFLKTK